MRRIGKLIWSVTFASVETWAAVGVASLVFGCWQVYRPAAFILFGVIILTAVYLIKRNQVR